MTNPWAAEIMQWLHPMRTRTYLLSDAFLPWMRVLPRLASSVAENRHALPDDHPLIVLERRLIAQVFSFWQIARRLRDASIERAFASTYGADTSLSHLAPLLRWHRLLTGAAPHIEERR
jgi:hypothetical protein